MSNTTSELTRVFEVLSRCTRDELNVLQAFITTQINTRTAPALPTHPQMNYSFSATPSFMEAPTTSAWRQPTPPKEVLLPPPAQPMAPLKKAAPPAPAPVGELLTDSNGDTYIYACKSGHIHGCKYFTNTVGPIDHLDPLCLYVTGFSLDIPYHEHRDDVIDTIGLYKSSSIHIARGRRYGFITFKKHAQAVAAQKKLLESNTKRSEDNQLEVNFADRTHRANSEDGQDDQQ
jgi:hypothetical protein